MLFSTIIRQMSRIVKPPDVVRGMKKLNKDLFTAEVNFPCFTARPKDLSKLLEIVNKLQLRKRGIKNVIHDSEALHTVLLDPVLLTDEKRTEIAEKIKKLGVPFEFSEKTVQLGFENWSIMEIFRAILPDLGLTSYSQIGHIVHLNLREEFYPYKEIIGDVLLEKVKNCRTVVNKAENIETKFRNFHMELIAGENDFITTVTENKCQFRMDFSKVFWNPRLSTEHSRLISTLAQKSLIYDVFAGIGPFAIPAIKRKRCMVVANDLNPDCYESLKENAKLNKVHLEKICNMDGAEFIKTVIVEDLKERLSSEIVDCIPSAHVIMNLPALAVDFLPNFIGILTEISPLPFPFWIHCYTFCKNSEDFSQEAENKVVDQFEPYQLENLTVHDVRDVAPNKHMMCVSFKLPFDALCGVNVIEKGPEAKKVKVQ